MVFNLSLLDNVVSEKKRFTPSEIDSIHYLFFEKGISYAEFSSLPIPYILKIVSTHIYMKKLEERAYKKAQKK